MKAENLRKALATIDDDAEVEVYDSDGNEWEIWSTHVFTKKKLFRINLY